MLKSNVIIDLINDLSLYMMFVEVNFEISLKIDLFRRNSLTLATGMITLHLTQWSLIHRGKRTAGVEVRSRNERDRKGEAGQ